MIKELNLEFEEEDSEKPAKKNDTVAVDVDLEFAKPPGADKTVTISKANVTATASKAAPSEAQVKNISEAKKSIAAAPKSATPVKEVSAPLISTDETALLKEQIRKMEFDSAVKVAVAEYKTEILAGVIGDMRFLEHQIGQLLIRIHKKHPDLKQEALMIKKLLADFSAKKRN